MQLLANYFVEGTRKEANKKDGIIGSSEMVEISVFYI